MVFDGDDDDDKDVTRRLHNIKKQLACVQNDVATLNTNVKDQLEDITEKLSDIAVSIEASEKRRHPDTTERPKEDEIRLLKYLDAKLAPRHFKTKQNFTKEENDEGFSFGDRVIITSDKTGNYFKGLRPSRKQGKEGLVIGTTKQNVYMVLLPISKDITADRVFRKANYTIRHVKAKADGEYPS